MTRPMMIAAILLALAGLFFTLQRIDDVAITPVTGQEKVPRYTLNEALLTRYDADGKPSLRATAKTLEYFDDESAQGETMNVDLLSDDVTTWNVVAPQGMLPAHGKSFLLQGDVVANGRWPDNNEPVTVRTTELWVDPNTHDMHTERGVTFMSMTRDGSSTGMRGNWINRNMSLLNDVKMRYETKR